MGGGLRNQVDYGAEEDGQDGKAAALRLSAQNDGEQQQITLIWHFGAEVRRNVELAHQFKHFLKGLSC